MSKQFAVLGHPIAHSLSPAIHTAFATQFDLPIAYDKMDVAPDRFRAFWHRKPIVDRSERHLPAEAIGFRTG